MYVRTWVGSILDQVARVSLRAFFTLVLFASFLTGLRIAWKSEHVFFLGCGHRLYAKEPC